MNQVVSNRSYLEANHLVVIIQFFLNLSRQDKLLFKETWPNWLVKDV